MAIGPETQNGEIITVAVMGATGTGKSTFVNLLSESGFEVGVGLLSCTPAVQVSKTFSVDNRVVRLIDTPGFDDTLKSDREILQMIASFLADQYRRDMKLSGVLYLHRISDFKMSGISRRNFGMFRSLCGEKTLKNVVVVTNMWGEVPEALGAARENELATDDQLFKPVLDSGARMMRHTNTLESAQAIIQALLDNHPIPLQIQSEIVDEHKSVDQTQASAELESEALAEQRRKQEEEFRKVKEANEAALRAHQEAQAHEMERLRKEREEEEARARAAHERFLAEQEEERRREEERIQAVQREMEEQAAARRAEEERVLRLEEERLRQAREHEDARRRHEAEMERLRHRNDGDCRIF